MTTERAATTTILFSDLVGSTELMQRAGDEDAQRIFKAHYQLLRDAVSANGGAEVKSLGDGLMVAFGAAADAVRCAINMQQASRRRPAAQCRHAAVRRHRHDRLDHSRRTAPRHPLAVPLTR
jgi:class 3 adenylate cyclase